MRNKKRRQFRRQMIKADHASRAALAQARRARRLQRRKRKRNLLGEAAPVHELVDRYYIRSHFPPRDVLTELGEESKQKKWPLIPLAIMALISAVCLFRDKPQ